MRRDPALEFLARHVRRIEAGARGLGRGPDEGSVPVEPVPWAGVDAEVRESVCRPRFAVGGLGREPPPQPRVLVGDLPQKDVAERAGRRDELAEDGRLARVEQGVVVVDRGPGKLCQPYRDVGGERQARGSCQREGARAQDRLHPPESSIIFAVMSSPEAHSMELDREALAAWYQRNRERSEALFDRVRPEAYESRPIALRNPICFYEGHIPAFAVNTLLKRGLGDAALDSSLRDALRARHRSGERSGRSAGRAVAGRRASRSAATARPPTAASSTRSRAATSPPPRTRCSRAASRRTRCSSTSRCTRRRSTTCGTGFRTTGRSVRRDSRRPGSAASPRRAGRSRSPRARRRSGPARKSGSPGTTSGRATSWTCRRSRSTSTA